MDKEERVEILIAIAKKQKERLGPIFRKWAKADDDEFNSFYQREMPESFASVNITD